jgi:hypothetical protein
LHEWDINDSELKQVPTPYGGYQKVFYGKELTELEKLQLAQGMKEETGTTLKKGEHRLPTPSPFSSPRSDPRA